jgi:hypothetical protein
MSRLSPRAGGGGGSSSAGGYVPPPSIGHEIGVMFGGIGSMLLGISYPSLASLSLCFFPFFDYKQERRSNFRIVADVDMG